MTQTAKIVRYALKWWLAAGVVYIGACEALPLAGPEGGPPIASWRVGLGIFLFLSAIALVITGFLAMMEIADNVDKVQ